MMNLFSDEARRNPYPLYDQLRAASPVLRVPPPFNGWMVFDYETVKWVLHDQEAFSSKVPAPKNWFIFYDPPAHTKLRALISRAFTPRVIANLEPRIRQISSERLDALADLGEADFAAEYGVPLPMLVIAGMIGIPLSDWQTYKCWSDVILRLSYSRNGDAQAEQSVRDFTAVTEDMRAYLGAMIGDRRRRPKDDLLTNLIMAEVDGERLTEEEILGFVQLLVVAGQETTSNVINNAMLCLMENPDELARLRAEPQLLESAIEEVLRYRSPLHWVMRTPRNDIEVKGQVIPKGAIVLPMIGSANRDPRQFPEPNRFDIARAPNAHVAFGHGIHFCLGAPLSRLEAKIALGDILARFRSFEPAGSDPWPPRQALHVHGPASLPLRLQPSRSAVQAR